MANSERIYLMAGNDTDMSVCLRKGGDTPLPYDLTGASRIGLALTGHGLSFFARDIVVSGEDNNIISGLLAGDLLVGEYGLEVSFTLDGKAKRFRVPQIFEVVTYLSEDQDGTAEGEGDGISITVTVQPEVIEIAGPTGPQGHDGKSAYEVWLEDGHTGDEDDFFRWLAAQTPNPDWAQNDASEPDYVEDRTHYDIPAVSLPDAFITFRWTEDDYSDLMFYLNDETPMPRMSENTWGVQLGQWLLSCYINGNVLEVDLDGDPILTVANFRPGRTPQPILVGDIEVPELVQQLDGKYLGLKTVNGQSVKGSGDITLNGGNLEYTGDDGEYISGGDSINDSLLLLDDAVNETNGRIDNLKGSQVVYDGEDGDSVIVHGDTVDQCLKGLDDQAAYIIENYQYKISDIDTIRAGAALGATAYQKPSTGIPKSALASAVKTSLEKADTALQPSDLNGYATEDYVDEEVSGKQDTLVSGENLKTINGESLLGSGNIVIQSGSADAVKYTEQELTDAQKTQARANIAAASESEVSQLRSDMDDVKDFVGMSPASKAYTLADMTKEVGYYINSSGNKQSTTNVWEIYSLEIDNHNGGTVEATLGANTSSYSAIALYNSTTMGAASLISKVLTQSTASYTVSLDIPENCRLIVICNRNGSNPSPTANVILSVGNTDSLAGQVKDIRLKLGGTDIELAQGGIDTSGRETVNAARVRTNILEGAFEVVVNSGYQVYYAYYYDESGTFVRSAAVSSPSFINDGGYNVRLAFAKSDATQPLTPDDNIIDTYKGGLEYGIEQCPIMTVCDSLSQIPSPSKSSLCFFKARNGAWSDGQVWREIVGNNLLISGTAYRTCEISDGSKVSGHNDETVLPLYSVTKLMTLVVVCDNVSDYSEQVTILADDIPSSTSDHYVQVGDVVTIDNLIASAVIVSDNPAAQALARVVGYKINPSAADDNAARSAFYAAMNAKASELGMINTTYGGAAWVGGNSTAADQCTLLREIYNNYPKITSYWGLLNYTMTITGSNARTYQITSTVSSADRNVIPEFVGGKTGTGNNLGNLAFVWSYNNDYYTTIIFQASPVNYRVKDAAQAIAETKELI